MTWWKRSKPESVGVALFRGSFHPRPEDLRLEARGVSVSGVQRTAAGWKAELRHASWGEARLVLEPGLPPPPDAVIRMNPRLSDSEREAVSSCRTALGLSVASRSGSVLQDRKDLLRFLRAVLGEEGIAGVDTAAQAIWTQQALDHELVHDADLDIDAVYTIHYVTEDEGESGREPRAFWLHTHGLGELGYFDLDVLEPAPELAGHAHELVRALAFMVVEGALVSGGAAVPLVQGAEVRAVPARAFLSGAAPALHRRYRQEVDDGHVEGHAVLCDPAPSGWLGRLFRGERPRASALLRGPFPEEVLIPFSDEATALMARRARETSGVLRGVVEELAEFEVQPLVKLGYPSDEGSREHLWFQVHGFGVDSVDATLVNAPFHVPSLKQGDRREHPLELLSDWVVFTPFGRIDPRQSMTLRFVRENRERLRELLKEAQAG